MYGQCIVAVYPSRSDAEKAFRAAVGSGIASDSVQISRADKPVWEWLFSKRVPEKDKKHYRSHLPDGETALSVLLDGASAEKIDALEDILDRFDPLDVHLDEGEDQGEVSASSSKESAKSAAPQGHAAHASSGGHQQHAESEEEEGHHAQHAQHAAAHHAHEHHDEEQIIPLPEEELNVSAQTTDRVRRVKTYVVEEPVEKEVSLRDERTIVERRPATSNDPGEIGERVYEFHERHDEPLIEKTMRVGEELVVRKEANQHTERVHGIVRRTKAEVEKDMGAQLSPPNNPRGR